MAYIHINNDEVLEDCSAVELAEALLKHSDWRKVLIEAQGKNPEHENTELTDPLRDIAEDIRAHRAIDFKLSRLIWTHVGVIV